MIADFTKYVEVKVTPSTTQMLSVINPLGVVPKYVHITCGCNSAPYTNVGYLRELWATQIIGGAIGTNGKGNVICNNHKPVNQTPTADEEYYLSDDALSFYKSNGSVSGRWHTETEYTVHIYA